MKTYIQHMLLCYTLDLMKKALKPSPVKKNGCIFKQMVERFFLQLCKETSLKELGFINLDSVLKIKFVLVKSVSHPIIL